MIEILKAKAFEKCLVSFTISAIELAPVATSCRPIRDLIADETPVSRLYFRVFGVFRGCTISRGLASPRTDAVLLGAVSPTWPRIWLDYRCNNQPAPSATEWPIFCVTFGPPVLHAQQLHVREKSDVETENLE